MEEYTMMVMLFELYICSRRMRIIVVVDDSDDPGSGAPSNRVWSSLSTNKAVSLV